MKKPKMTFGKFILELKNFREIKGHDDSLPFEGELYCNGVHIAGCWNDGWGGDANVKPVIGNLKLYNEVSKIVCATKWDCGKFALNYSIPMVCDLLACDNEAYEWVKREQKNHLVFKCPNERLTSFSFQKGGKKIPIAELLRTATGVALIKKSIAEHTAKNEILLNSNIRYPKVVLK